MNRADRQRKQKGVYYTPPRIAVPLTRWAIRSPRAVTFDPSHGGCAFLAAAVRRLTELCAPNPYQLVFGADNDPGSVKYVQPLIAHGAEPRQFHIGDFLAMPPGHFGRCFPSVVGNPPYVRHHRLSARVKQSLDKTPEGRAELNRQASYWAFFVMHALRFLERGGRLAFVLPGAVLHADYAGRVRQAFLERFASVSALILEERVFDDAEEESVLILAEGFGGGSDKLRIGSAAVKEIEAADADLEELATTSYKPISSTERWSRGLLSRSLAVYSRVARRMVELGSLADLRIGTVTGGNEYFILRPSEAALRGIRRHWTTPIIARSAGLGLEFTNADLNELIAKDEKCLLVSGGSKHAAIRNYFRAGRRLGIHLRQKCRTRYPWHSVRLETRCDAFLKYMCSSGPALTVNAADVACTNSLYAVSWKMPVNAKMIALAVQSTIAQLSAECSGRVLGGGLLKLEPSDARRILIPPITPRLIRAVTSVPSRVSTASVAERIDEALIGDAYAADELVRLRSMLRQLRRMRTRSKELGCSP